jgi:hypothetical protein
MTEATSATCYFDEIHVELVGSKVFAPKTLQDIPFEVTWKHIFMSSGYKVAWKNITLVECHEDGACLRLETPTQNFSCQQHPAHTNASSPAWLKCRKLVEHIWKKKQRKLEKEKQKQELLEHKSKKQKKLAANTSTSWKRNTYSKRPLKFLMANQNNNQWDTDDDEEDGVFNQGGHKKRRQEQEPVDLDLDEQLLQEQSAERAVEDVDLQEMEQELDEQEEPQDAGEVEFQDEAGEAEFQDENEPEEEEPSLDEEQELVQETTTTTPKARSKRRLLKKKRPRIQLDSDDEDDLFADPKVTTPGLQTRRIVSPSLANLNRLNDDDEEQDDTPMHNQDQEGLSLQERPVRLQRVKSPHLRKPR